MVLDAVSASLYDATAFCRQMQLLQMPSEAMLAPAVAAALTSAGKDLSATLERLESASSTLATTLAATMPPVGVDGSSPDADGDYPPRAPLVFTPELLGVIASACTALEDCASFVLSAGRAALPPDDLPGLSGQVTVADVFPSWDRLQTILCSAVSNLCDLCQTLPSLPPLLRRGAPPDGQSPTGDMDVATDVLLDVTKAAQSALEQSLIWAQGTRGHDVGGVEAGQFMLPQAVQVLITFLQSSCTGLLCRCLRECVHSASQAPLARAPDASAMSWRLHAVLGCCQTTLAGMRGCLAHASLLHAATGKLAVTVTSLFLAYVREGFGDGEGEVEDGEGGDGTGVMFLMVYIFAVLACTGASVDYQAFVDVSLAGFVFAMVDCDERIYQAQQI